MEHTPRRSVLRHAGETIVHLGETIEGDFATLRSKIVTMKRAEISVDYRLYRSANRWVAIDVALENVSVVADYRQRNACALATGVADPSRKRHERERRNRHEEREIH